MKFSLPPKLVEKLVWSQLFRFVKYSFPVTRLMPCYAETDRIPNCLTSLITLLICSLKCFDLYK
jgi:hypothetical protein